MATPKNKAQRKARLARSGGWVAACESLLAEADRLRNEASQAAATTPSFLLDEEHKAKMWRAAYYREAAGWLLMQRPNGEISDGLFRR